LWALAAVVGIGLIVVGVFQVVMSIADHRDLPLWGLWLLFGVLSVVIGIVALAWPAATVLVLSVMLGAYLFVDGIMMVVFAFSLRRFNNSPMALA
jgi:uncharacterized membrane protein HdeD (DUF308 family)